MPPKRARPVTTVLAHPTFASLQVSLSKRPLSHACPGPTRPLMAARGSSFSPTQCKLSGFVRADEGHVCEKLSCNDHPNLSSYRAGQDCCTKQAIGEDSPTLEERPTWHGCVANVSVQRVRGGQGCGWRADDGRHGAQPLQNGTGSLQVICHYLMTHSIHSHDLQSSST